jgi:hypothetical protein
LQAISAEFPANQNREFLRANREISGRIRE